MIRRFFFFFLTNILVVLTISIVLSLLGVRGYITAGGLDFNALIVICLVWGFAGSFISLLMSKFMAKRMMGVEIFESNDSRYGWLVRKVYTLAKSAGLEKMPEVGVYESPEVNAFATGPSKNNSLVAVSTGLLQRMNEEEIEGVLAHEMAHVKNGDMVTMALIQGVINAFVMFLSRVLAFAISNALRKNDDDEGPVANSYFMQSMITFVLEMVFSVLGMFVVSYFSRMREFRADAGGAQLAGRGKMVQALRKLQSTVEMVDSTQHQFQAMKISGKGVFALLSTHPPLSERIEVLERGI